MRYFQNYAHSVMEDKHKDKYSFAINKETGAYNCKGEVVKKVISSL